MKTRFKVGKDGLLATAGIVVVLVFALLSFKDFSDQCFEYTYDMNIRRLGELSAENVDAIRIEFRHAEEYVKSVAASLSYMDDIMSPQAFELLGKMLSFSSFNRMWIVNPDGRAYDKDGMWLDVVDLAFFNEAKMGQSGILKIPQSSYNDKEVFLVFSPIFKGDEFIGVVSGVYELHSLIVNTANSQFDGFGYTHVFNSSGEMIIRSENRHSLVDKINIWDFFKSVKFEGGSDYDSFYQNVQLGKEGVVIFRKDGQERMGYYTPVGVNNWYMISMTSNEVVADYSKSINSFAFMLVLKVFSCFMILIAGIIYYSRKIRSRIMRTNNLLNISNQRFRIAAFHLTNDVIEYDIQKDAVYRIGDDPAFADTGRPIGNLADDLIEDRTLTGEALSVFRGALEQLKTGEKNQSCVLEAYDGAGKREWYDVVLTSIFDTTGKPVRAIGTIEDITRQKETEIRFAQEEQYRLAMMAEALETFVFDVTKGRYLYGYKRDEEQTSETDTAYQSELNIIVREIVHSDDRDKVLETLSLVSLKDRFDKGDARIEFDFRGRKGAGGETWLNCTTNLVINPETKDLIGYAYIKDITKSKRSELELKHEAERDSLTGLYNRNTSNRLIEEYLDRIDPNSVSAFFMIDLDRFKYVNDTYGHAAGDETLRAMADRLNGIFRQTDIVGRMGGDEFIVFVKDTQTQEAAENKADGVCRALKEIRISADKDYRISGSVGVCIVPEDGTKLETLYARADLALYAAKKAGKDRYMVFDVSMEKAGQ